MTQGYVWFGLACLHTDLLTYAEARVESPDELRMQSFFSLINAKDPSFSNVFGFVDGFNLPFENHCNADVQIAYYNG